MNKNLFNIKKGALTTQQIVLLIILIASFVVILYFFISADLGGESEKEVCHNSVVMKSHSALPGDTELNCHRSYICITKDGSCEGMSKPEKKEVENVEEVYQVLADEMAECWWMFGEGKIDYVGKDAFLKKNYCSICSQILFDDSLLEFEKIENGKIDKDNLYEYMSNKTISSGLNQKEKSKTYLEYLLKTNNISRIKQKIVSSGNYTPDKEPSFGEIRVGLPHYVVMGVTSEVAGRAWKIAGAVITAVGGIFIPGPGWTYTGAVVGALIFGAGEVGAGINPEIGAIAVEGEGIDNTFMAPTIVEVDSEKFEALNCEEIITYA